MIQVIGIGGVPASGKSTVVRRILKAHGDDAREYLKAKAIEMISLPALQTLVLGQYPDDGDKATFGGTDRLSMSCQPQAVEFVTNLSQSPQFRGWTVLFEGDRLFNGKFIRTVNAIREIEKRRWIIVEAESNLLAERHLQRGDSQTEKWLQGRKSKTAGIIREFGDGIELWDNNTDYEGNVLAVNVIGSILEHGGLTEEALTNEYERQKQIAAGDSAKD